MKPSNSVRKTLLLLGIFLFGIMSIPIPVMAQISPVAYYPFDGNAYDSSENGYDGNICGYVPSANDRSGNSSGAYYFDGTITPIDGTYTSDLCDSSIFSANYISIPITASSLLNIRNAMTVAAWVNPVVNQGVPHGLPIVTKYRSRPGERAYWLYAWTLGTQGPSFAVDTQNGLLDAYTTELLPLNTWSFVVGTYDGSVAKLYVNGQLKNTIGNIVPGGQINVSSRPLTIGGVWEGTDGIDFFEAFKGSIDDVSIYDYALTDYQISVLYTDNFLPPATFTLTYTPELGGTINGSISPLSYTVYSGNSGPSIKAIPFPGYYFKGWEDGSPYNPRIDTTSKNVTAIFDLVANSTLLTKTDPPGGTYNVPQYVNFTQIGSSTGTVHYTMGTAPLSPIDSSLTTVPVYVDSTTTIKFAAFDGTNWEPVKTEVYTFVDTSTTGASIALTRPTENDPYPAGNIPVTVTFPQIDNTIKPDCFSNTHFELFPCVLSETTQCDPLPSLCRIRQAYGPGDVGNIAVGETLNCNLGDMYDPSILNQLTAGNYTIKATYSNYIPINLNLDAVPPDPKILWTGAIELTSSPINLYKFTGFLPPVDNPTVWNVAKAGQTIPVKWKMSNGDVNGNTGMVVSIKGKAILCPGSSDASDDIEIYDPDSQASLLQCASDGSCQYDWKTLKGYGNNCYTLVLKLTDSTERTANFLFKSK